MTVSLRDILAGQRDMEKIPGSISNSLRGLPQVAADPPIRRPGYPPQAPLPAPRGGRSKAFPDGRGDFMPPRPPYPQNMVTPTPDAPDMLPATESTPEVEAQSLAGSDKTTRNEFFPNDADFMSLQTLYKNKFGWTDPALDNIETLHTIDPTRLIKQGFDAANDKELMAVAKHQTSIAYRYLDLIQDLTQKYHRGEETAEKFNNDMLAITDVVRAHLNAAMKAEIHMNILRIMPPKEKEYFNTAQFNIRQALHDGLHSAIQAKGKVITTSDDATPGLSSIYHVTGKNTDGTPRLEYSITSSMADEGKAPSESRAPMPVWDIKKHDANGLSYWVGSADDIVGGLEFILKAYTEDEQ